MTGVITHLGTVVKVTAAKVSVKITDTGDKCGGCSAKFLCKPNGDDDVEVVEVAVNGEPTFKEGEQVKLTLSDSRQYSATLLALLYPCIALGIGVAVGYVAGLDEGLCALSGLAATAVYFGALYMVRDKINRKFSWNVSPLS